MKVLIDEQIPRRLAKSLHGLLSPEHEFHHARDYFGPRITDLEWIKHLNAEGGWIVISGDRRIRRNKNEALAFSNSDMIAFFLSPGLEKAGLLKQMERLVALWPAIETTAGVVAGGAMFELPIKSNRLRQIR